MNRKLTGLALIPAALLASTLAQAGRPHERDYRFERDARYERYDDADYARVLDATPIMERVRRVEPVETCWDEERPAPRADRSGATVAGGLLGAVIGHQFGSGSGRRAATVAGAVIGGAIANDAAARREARDYDGGWDRGYRVEQRCAVHDEVRFEERVRAWRVSYRFHGRDYVTEMPYDPGPRLRVAVEARPL